MPKIDDIDNLGPMIYKLGLQPLGEEISKEDRREYNSVFTPEILNKILPTRTPVELPEDEKPLPVEENTADTEDSQASDEVVDGDSIPEESSQPNALDDVEPDSDDDDLDMGEDLNLDGLDDLVSDLGDDLNTLDNIENDVVEEEPVADEPEDDNEGLDLGDEDNEESFPPNALDDVEPDSDDDLDMGEDLNLDGLDDLVSDLGDDLNTLDNIENDVVEEEPVADEPEDDNEGLDLGDEDNEESSPPNALDDVEPDSDDDLDMGEDLNLDGLDDLVSDLGDDLNTLDNIENDVVEEEPVADEPEDDNEGLDLGDEDNEESSPPNALDDVEPDSDDDDLDMGEDLNLDGLDDVEPEQTEDTSELTDDLGIGELDDILDDDEPSDLGGIDSLNDIIEEGEADAQLDDIDNVSDNTDDITDLDDVLGDLGDLDGDDLDSAVADDLEDDEPASADDDLADEPVAEEAVEEPTDDIAEDNQITDDLGNSLDIEDLDDLSLDLDDDEPASADDDLADEPVVEEAVEEPTDDIAEDNQITDDLGNSLDIEDLDDLSLDLDDDEPASADDDLADEPAVDDVAEEDNAVNDSEDDFELGELDDLMSDMDHLEIKDTDDTVDDFDDLLDNATTSDDVPATPNSMSDIDDVIDDLDYFDKDASATKDNGDVDMDGLDVDLDLDNTDEDSGDIDISAFDAENEEDDFDDDDDLLGSLSDDGDNDTPIALDGDSKYASIDEHLTEEDIEKILSGISFLPLNVQEHVVDAILNDKLDENSMGLLITSLGEAKGKKEIGKILKDKLGIDVNKSGVYGDDRMGSIKSAVFGSYLPVLIKTAAVSLIILLVLVGSYKFIYRPLAANSYFKAGYNDLVATDYNSAERNFERGNALNPNQIKWFNKYANGYIERNAFTFAAEKIEDALEIDNVKFETKMTQGAYFKQKAEFDMSPELYDDGEALYDTMLRLNYKKKERLQIYDAKGLLEISRARILGEKSYYANAYETYKQMIAEYGDNVIARKRGMLINIYTDNYDNVKNQALRIEILQKGYFDDEVYPEYARYLLDKGEFHESRLLLEKILSKYPENILTLVTLADYYGRINHYDTAEKILTAVLALYDQEPHRSGREYVHNMLGQYYYIQGNYARALNEFEDAIAINTLYPDANYNLGNIYYYYESDYDKALNYYQVAYANMLDEYKPTALSFNLGWIYYRNEEYDSAFEYFYDIYDGEQNNVVLNYALGNSLVNIDKSQLAEGFYLDALTLLLRHRDSFGTLYMVRSKEFETLNYLASLYNNIGVVNVNRYIDTEEFKYDRAAFQNFVRASELFDQVRTARGDLIRESGRTINIDNQSTGIATYNLLILQSGVSSYERIAVDNYIPKDLYYVGQKPFERKY